jgi:hypothetical protein
MLLALQTHYLPRREECRHYVTFLGQIISVVCLCLMSSRLSHIANPHLHRQQEVAVVVVPVVVLAHSTATPRFDTYKCARRLYVTSFGAITKHRESECGETEME